MSDYSLQFQHPSATFLAQHAPLGPVMGLSGIVAHQASDVLSLWEAWEEVSGSRQDVPYWASVWPAARALGTWVLDNTEVVAGKRLLEIGCGGAVASIAALQAGAETAYANDVDQVALHIAALNAAANKVALQRVLGDLSIQGALPPVDIVLVADFFYNQVHSVAMTAVLKAIINAGARVIIADGGRPFAPQQGIRELASVTLSVDWSLEGVSQRVVRVGEMMI